MTRSPARPPRNAICGLIACLLFVAPVMAQPRDRFGPPPSRPHYQYEHPQHRLAQWYVSESMRQNEEARRMMCGFTGQRWALDADMHYRWALRASPRRVYRELEERDRHLARCRSNKLREGQPPEGRTFREG